MRHNLLKKHSTKQERIVYEVLKDLHIPFRHRWLVDGFEIDFLLFDKVCLEINGHPQDGQRNHTLASLGYVPVHVQNAEVTREYITSILLQLNGSYKLP